MGRGTAAFQLAVVWVQQGLNKGAISRKAGR